MYEVCFDYKRTSQKVVSRFAASEELIHLRILLHISMYLSEH